MNKVIQYPYKHFQYLTKHARLCERAEQHTNKHSGTFRSNYVKQYAQELLDERCADRLLAIHEETRYGYEITKDGINVIEVSTTQNDAMIKDMIDVEFFKSIKYFLDRLSYRFEHRQERITSNCSKTIDFCLEEVAVDILNKIDISLLKESTVDTGYFEVYTIFTFDNFIFMLKMCYDPESTENGLDPWYRDERPHNMYFYEINSITDNVLCINLCPCSIIV